MKVLFTGVGSIGTRHVGNLTKVCSEKGIDLTVDVMRYSDRVLPDELKKSVKKEIRNTDEIDNDYDVVFITDETKTHFDNIISLKNKCKHMFIEKPIFDNADYDLDKIRPENSDSVYYVAAPIRFTEYYKCIKEIVDNNKVHSARIIFSSYMPNWQKGRDYTKSFRCFTERGGGVDIDSLHDIDYMTAVFGQPTDVKRIAGHYSNLKMDACDIATYLFDYDDKIVEVHLDYFGRVPNRRVELFAEEDVFVIDFNKKTAVKQLQNEEFSFAPDDNFYYNEMNYFVDLISSNGTLKNINTIDNAFQSLKLAKGII
jgi:predicted dehydrogenase